MVKMKASQFIFTGKS